MSVYEIEGSGKYEIHGYLSVKLPGISLHDDVRRQMEIFVALLALRAENLPMTGELP